MPWQVKGKTGVFTFADSVSESDALAHVDSVDQEEEKKKSFLYGAPSLENVKEESSIGALQALSGIGQGVGDVAQKVIGGPENKLQQLSSDIQRSTSERMQQIIPPDAGIVAQGLHSGASSAVQTLPWVAGGLAAGLTRGLTAGGAKFGTNLAVTGLGAQTGFQRFGELRSKGFSPGDSAIAGTWDGLVEKYTELLPVGSLLTRGPAKNWFLGFLAKEGLGEQAATILQDLEAKYTDRPDMTLGDLGHDMAVTAVATAVGAPIQMGAMAPLHAAANFAASKMPEVPAEVPSELFTTPPTGNQILSGREGAPDGLHYGSEISDNPKVFPRDGEGVAHFTDPAVTGLKEDSPLARLITNGAVPLSTEVRNLLEVNNGLYADPQAASELLGAMQLKKQGTHIAHFTNPETGKTTTVDLRSFDTARAAKELLAGLSPTNGQRISIDSKEAEQERELAKAMEPSTTVTPTELTSPPSVAPSGVFLMLKGKEKGKPVKVTFPTQSHVDVYRIGSQIAQRRAPHLSIALSSEFSLPTAAMPKFALNFYNSVRAQLYNSTSPEIQVAPTAVADAEKAKGMVRSGAPNVPTGSVVLAKGVTATPNLNRAVVQLKAWIKIFAPEMRLIVLGEGKSGSLQILDRQDGALGITVPTSGSSIFRLFSLAHEFGHALVEHHLWKPENSSVLASMQQDWKKAVEMSRTQTVEEFAKMWMGPWKIEAILRTGSYKGIPLDAPASQVVESIDSRQHKGYTLSFDEFAAEQVARFFAKREDVSFNNSRKWYEEVLAKLQDFFARVVAKLKIQPSFEAWLESLAEKNATGNVAEASAEIQQMKDEEAFAEIAKFDDEVHYTLETIEFLRGKTKSGFVGRHEVVGALKRPGVKAPEKKIIERVLEKLPGEKVSVEKLATLAMEEVYPYAPVVEGVNQWGDTGISSIGGGAERHRNARSYLFMPPFELPSGTKTHFADKKPLFFVRSTWEGLDSLGVETRVETEKYGLSGMKVNLFNAITGDFLYSRVFGVTEFNRFSGDELKNEMLDSWDEFQENHTAQKHYFLEVQSDFFSQFAKKTKDIRKFIAEQEKSKTEKLPLTEKDRENLHKVAVYNWFMNDVERSGEESREAFRQWTELGLSAQRIETTIHKLAHLKTISFARLMQEAEPELWGKLSEKRQEEAAFWWRLYMQDAPTPSWASVDTSTEDVLYFSYKEVEDFKKLQANLSHLPKDWWQLAIKTELARQKQSGGVVSLFPTPETVRAIEGWPTVGAASWELDRIEGYLSDSIDATTKGFVDSEGKVLTQDLPAQKYFEQLRQKVQQFADSDYTTGEKDSFLGELSVYPLNPDHAGIFLWYRDELLPWIEKTFGGERVWDNGREWHQIQLTSDFSPVVTFYDEAAIMEETIGSSNFAPETKIDVSFAFKSALYTFQMQQMAKAFPQFPWIKRFSQALRAMSNYKNQLMAGPNQRISEYYNLSVADETKVGEGLRKEYDDRTHWFELKTNPDGSHEFVVTPSTVRIAQTYKISERAMEFMRKLKNDYLGMLDETEKTLMEAMAKHYKNDSQTLLDAQEKLAARFEEYRQTPFLPNSRFGKYALLMRAPQDFTDNGVEYKKGEVIYLELLESKWKWKERHEELMKQFKPKGFVITASIFPDKIVAYQGLPMELVSELTNQLNERGLGLNPEQLQVLSELSFTGTKAGRFAKQFENPARRVGGASKDIRRVYGAYMWKMSNALSKLKYGGVLNGILHDLRMFRTSLSESGNPTGKHDLVYERLLRQREYVMQPQKELQALRGWVSLWYLWAAPKTAIMNFTSTPLLTYPYLWARFGAPKSFGMLLKSMKWAKQVWLNPEQFERDHPELKVIADRALADGIRDQSFAAMLASAANANSLEDLIPKFDVLGGKKTSDAMRKITWRMIDAGMTPFKIVEKFNRDVALFATYQLSRESGKSIEDSYNDAVDSVDATQSEYSSWARSELLQGPKSAALLFFSFVQNMSFLMYGGDKSWWRALLMMAMLGGLLGIPGIENVLDMIDWVARKFLGKHVDLRQDAREYVDSLGANPDLILHGLSRMGSFDLSSSVGAGRIIPGTEAIFGVGDFNQRFVQAAGDIGGPIGSLGMQMLKAVANENPNSWALVDALLPPALRQIERGLQMSSEGRIMDSRGQTLVEDPTLTEIVGQYVGFTSLRKAEKQEMLRHVRQASTYYQMRRALLMGRLYLAKKSGDVEMKQDALAQIRQYNSIVPNKALRLTSEDIARSLKARQRHDLAQEKGLAPTKRDQGLYEQYGSAYPTLGG